MAPLWKTMLSRSSPLYREALYSFSLWEWRAQERELLLLKRHSDRERTAMLAQLNKLSKELQQKDKIIESLRAKLNHHRRSDTPSSSHALSDTTDQSDRISYLSDERGSTNEDLELCSDVEAASELGQEETQTRISTDSQHGASISRHPAAPSPITSSHRTQSCLSCPSMQCSSSPHRPAGFSTPQSKPLPGFSFAHQQPVDPSSFLPLSFQGFHPSPFGSAASSSSLDPGMAMNAGANLLESSALWEMAYRGQPARPGADLSSGSSGYQSGTNHTGSDLTKEDLMEIRSLRQRLEDSIQTNDRLRHQLEEKLARTATEKGAPTNIYIQSLDSVSQLSGEIRLLKEENMQLTLAHRESRKEAEQLREAVLLERSKLKKVELDVERWAERNRKLQAETDHHRGELTELKQDRQKNQETINSLQHEVSVLQQQLDESRGLVLELQDQLQTSGSLREVTTNTHSAASSPPDRVSDGSFSDHHGFHDVGHHQDFKALQQQLLEGSSLLLKMEAALRSLNASQKRHQPSDSGCIRKLLSDTKTLKQVLQEAGSLLRRFWRAALPGSEQTRQDESLRDEVVSLRLKLSQQEQALKDTMERLESSNLTKDSMEHFIVSQLSRTRDVLKKAKTNLQVKSQEAAGSSPGLLIGVS